MQNTVSLLPVKEEQIAFNIWDLIDQSLEQQFLE